VARNISEQNGSQVVSSPLLCYCECSRFVPIKKLSACNYKHNDTSSKSRAYFVRHCVPLLVAALVAKHIVDFGGNENPNDQDINDDKVTIAPTIQWAIIRTIYEVRTHIADLDHHYRHVRT
jgi:hypothetical protein